jgi:hypothetical protein
MAKSFELVSFRHVYGVLNFVAHNLARHGEFSVNAAWRDVPPACIREAICNDIMIIDQ